VAFLFSYHELRLFFFPSSHFSTHVDYFRSCARPLLLFLPFFSFSLLAPRRPSSSPASSPPLPQAQDVAAEAEEDELDDLLDFAKNLGTSENGRVCVVFVCACLVSSVCPSVKAFFSLLLKSSGNFLFHLS
jgi:hypothetical protein